MLPNATAPITEDLWAKITGTTYRDILEEIAGATGSIAVIGRGDDTLNFETPPVSEASETLTEANLITAKIGENWGKASAVVLSRQPQGDNIEVVDQTTADSPGGRNQLRTLTTLTMGNNGSATHSFDGENLVINTSASGSSSGAYFNKNQGTNAIQCPPLFAAGNTVSFTAQSNISTTLWYGCETSQGGGTRSKVEIGTTPVRLTYKTGYNEETNRSAHSFYGVMRDGAIITISDFMVEEGSTAHSYEPFKLNGRVDLVIANNEILDPQRETTAQPILDAVKGWEYRNAELKTEGHGYHEIGDRLDVSVAGEVYPTIVTKSTIIIDGGIKETLTSATPEVIPIDYAKSGGITKTVFRTELTVDKQAQQIDSIVSRQDATDAAVAEQFTQVTQNLTSIVANVQSTGGGNLIRNSVGFGKDNDGILTIWQYGTGASATTVHSQSAPASLSAGAVSGHEIQMTGASIISQDISLTPGEKYTLALRAKKNTAGAVTITVGNTTNSETITLAAGTAYDWQRQSVEFTPTMGANTVTITVPSGASVELTDLILTTGGAMTWRQASGEIYNAQVSLDQAGVQVRSSVYTGDYVEITPLEFSGWSNASGTMKKVFTLNRETTEVEQLEARSQIKMPPIKIVPINNSSYKGWAFVKEE